MQQCANHHPWYRCECECECVCVCVCERERGAAGIVVGGGVAVASDARLSAPAGVVVGPPPPSGAVVPNPANEEKDQVDTRKVARVLFMNGQMRDIMAHKNDIAGDEAIRAIMGKMDSAEKSNVARADSSMLVKMFKKSIDEYRAARYLNTFQPQGRGKINTKLPLLNVRNKKGSMMRSKGAIGAPSEENMARAMAIERKLAAVGEVGEQRQRSDGRWIRNPDRFSSQLTAQLSAAFATEYSAQPSEFTTQASTVSNV